MDKLITISVELTRQQAWDLAQFLKRAGFYTYRECAQDDAEANSMLRATEEVRKELARAGFAPR